MKWYLLLSAVPFFTLLSGQDTRKVIEPVFPPSCVVLDARSAAVDDETESDTARIQAALNHCQRGHAVELKKGAFLAGPLELRAGVTLLITRGAVLFASRNPRDYDLTPGSCGTVTQEGHGCKPFITAVDVAGAGVMGDGAIDGRGGVKLIGQKDSWWDLAQEAKVRDLNQNCPRLLHLVRANDFTLYRITLKNSPNFHVLYSGGKGFTAWAVKIDSPKTARNTDGIDPANATDVTIVHSFIRTGDDNIAIKAGAGPQSSHMTIDNNHFYSGHGMSIGSETDGGAKAIRVSNLTIEGADNGIRIKSNSSRGGLVQDVRYTDVCIRDTKNPILMDTHYSFRGTATDKIPEFRDIVLRAVQIEGGGKITLDGFDPEHPLRMIFDGVFVRGVSLNVEASHARIQAAAQNLELAGKDVHLTPISSTAQPGCADKFLPFPTESK